MAFNLAFDKAGNNIAARMAMMAMTTNNSIKVKPWRPQILLTFILQLFHVVAKRSFYSGNLKTERSYTTRDNVAFRHILSDYGRNLTQLIGLVFQFWTSVQY